ncbi:MFS-type transporter SLC18B1-like [Lingula anatina]|uniref:MFS-type transporter SLC18B1-like n=1 Tax=Lingula anatina TaxID=7574 RepID=A0A1S3H392_LINAN|nr:MFS-type transporter SLC18B1-like [Lingula anatina]|eukprot:XP_013380478.1 MFS-type transporter SLC18B1-like [Lingula anatina]
MERKCEEIHDAKEGMSEEIEDEKEGRGETVKKNIHVGEELLKLSSRQKFTLMNGALANFASSTCYTVMQPFLRDEAIKKDVSLTGAGAIFGCYEVVMFSCSLIIGSQLSRIGSRRCFYTGTFVIGVSSLSFGLLGTCPPGDTFLGLAVSIRMIESLGAAMMLTANYALATKEFRDNVATAYGFLEMCAGFGHVFGPLVGGGLYQLGGFGLPFFVTGPMTIVIASVAFFTLPNENKDEERPSDYGQLIKLAKIPAIPLEQLAVWVEFFGLCALSPTLGGHLQNVRFFKL